ncbi:putative F-box protein At4g38870 [Bidens hawaiensis]|uniref:putative F-box protein At4g38870 n=1 Tax=Bidens hawaiensis TaxID=980011 RepID=UPI00404A879C
MTAFHIPDDIICNITARLSAKPLLRFRCLSRYWYRRLREPNFMKLRSRKSIILPLNDTFKLMDDTSNLIVVDRCHPLHTGPYRLTVVGTLNGLVLLAISEYLIVYNPLTGASRQLPRPPSGYHRDAHGFGYGASPDDLKIVRFSKYFDI